MLEGGEQPESRVREPGGVHGGRGWHRLLGVCHYFGSCLPVLLPEVPQRNHESHLGDEGGSNTLAER